MVGIRAAAAASLAASAGLVALGAAEGGKAPSFDQHLEEHGLSYHSNEYHTRKELFEKSVERVEKQNGKKGALWKAAVNKFSTLTEKEMERYYGYMKTTGEKRASGPQPRRSGTPPGAYDWREAHPQAVTPVKNQGHCGSCWAFAATAVMETVIAVATGKLFNLSPQPLVACMPNLEECGGSGGCHGATPQLAYTWVANNGLPSIWKYPYTSGTYIGDGDRNGECMSASHPPVASIGKLPDEVFVQIVQNDALALIMAVLEAPVTVSVAAHSWHDYCSGIYNGCGPDIDIINHAVVVMGYGTDDSIPSPRGGGTGFWTIRNSWGLGWGENGYMRLWRANPDNEDEDEPCTIDNQPLSGYSCASNPPDEITVCGMCGVLSDSSYPINPSLGAPPVGPPCDPAVNQCEDDDQRLYEASGHELLPAASPTSTMALAAAAALAALAALAAVVLRRRPASIGSAQALVSAEEGTELEPVVLE